MKTKTQKRKKLSISEPVFDKLKKYADARGMKMWYAIELAITILVESEGKK